MENMVNGLGRQILLDRTMDTFLAVGEACIAILWPTPGENFTALGSQHRGP